MYHYRNKKTGAVVKTHNKIAGSNWELAEDTDSQMTNGEDFEEDTFEEDTFEEDTFEDAADDEEAEQTTVAEEAPAEKPKTSRRGKK